MPKTDFGCTTYVCDDPSGVPFRRDDASSIPFWFVALLLILLVLLLVSFIQPKKPPPTLKEAVNKVFDNYEKQAQVWGNIEAEDAFKNARRDVLAEVDKYEVPAPKPS